MNSEVAMNHQKTELSNTWELLSAICDPRLYQNNNDRIFFLQSSKN
mgnify:CR=1 FL=1